MGERVILVTGASSGLGAAAARRLAQEPGARLVLVARRAERLEALAAALPAPATWVAADLTAADAPERVRAHVEEHHGGLHVLVNNAGRGARGRFGETGYANVRSAMELNFDAQLRLTEALLPLLRRSAPSAIVNVASSAARVARPGTAGVLGLQGRARRLERRPAAEEARHGVHVGTVLPGFIPTEGFPQRELVERRSTRWLLGTPEQAAEAIADVALERAGGALRPALLRRARGAADDRAAPGPPGAWRGAARTVSRRLRASRRRPQAGGIGWLPTMRPARVDRRAHGLQPLVVRLAVERRRVGRLVREVDVRAARRRTARARPPPPRRRAGRPRPSRRRARARA